MVTASQKCGVSEERGITFLPSSGGSRPIRASDKGASSGFPDDGPPLICPTCQTLTRRKQVTGNAVKQLRQVETAVGYHGIEIPAACRQARAALFAMMSMCP